MVYDSMDASPIPSCDSRGLPALISSMVCAEWDVKPYSYTGCDLSFIET